MADKLELYHNDMSTCAQKVRMVLAEKSLEWEGHHVDLRQGEQFKPDFRKLNPKSMVPVLIHNSTVLTESNAIIQYLDEVFPDPPLMPDDPVERAMIRKWLIHLDSDLHREVAVISFCIAFRLQVLEANKTPEELEAFYTKIPDKGREMMMREMVSDGLDSTLFMGALGTYIKLLGNMEAQLAKHQYLIGETINLADIAYIPYITRLDQLQLHKLWADSPKLTDWYERMKSRESYQVGFEKWKNPKYTGMMESVGKEAWPKIEALLD